VCDVVTGDLRARVERMWIAAHAERVVG
jgi:hypothetical protein